MSLQQREAAGTIAHLIEGGSTAPEQAETVDAIRHTRSALGADRVDRKTVRHGGVSGGEWSTITPEPTRRVLAARRISKRPPYFGDLGKPRQLSRQRCEASPALMLFPPFLRGKLLC